MLVAGVVTANDLYTFVTVSSTSYICILNCECDCNQSRFRTVQLNQIHCLKIKRYLEIFVAIQWPKYKSATNTYFQSYSRNLLRLYLMDHFVYCSKWCHRKWLVNWIFRDRQYKHIILYDVQSVLAETSEPFYSSLNSIYSVNK